MGWRWALGLVALLAVATVAWAQQGATVNPIVGSVWTYLGATYGADWLLPAQVQVPYAPNLANLVGVIPSTGQIYRGGYYTPGDGGGMLYTHSSSPCPLAGGVGDNGSQVKAADGGCWLAALPASGADARVWGAKCDGTTGDSTAIQAAVLSAAVVQLTTNCVLNTPISLVQHLKLAGQNAGRAAPPTLWCKTATSDCITVPNADGVVLRDLEIDGSAMSGGNILTLQSVSDFLADNVYLNNGFNGVDIVAGNNMVFSNSFINLVRGQYALKWDSASAVGDQLTMTNTLVACGYNATPANTAEGIQWDGNTKTFNITNVSVLRCGRSFHVMNSRHQQAYPQFLFANNLQLEGAVNNAFVAESGSSFWITNSYIDNNWGATGQGNGDGPDMELLCDTAASANCGGNAWGASVNLWMSNTHVFSSRVTCLFNDWRQTQIDNTTVELCSLGSAHTNPQIIYDSHAGFNTLSSSYVGDGSGSYAVETHAGGVKMILKNNFLFGNLGAVNDLAQTIDGIDKSVQWFLQIASGTTVSSAVGADLVKINTAVCSPSGTLAGGNYFVSFTNPPNITVTQQNSATVAYNCIIGGY